MRRHEQFAPEEAHAPGVTAMLGKNWSAFGTFDADLGRAGGDATAWKGGLSLKFWTLPAGHINVAPVRFLLSFVAVIMGATAVLADTFPVTDGGNDNAIPVAGTLRDAVTAANTTPQGPHTVNFQLGMGNTVTLNAGTLPINATQTFLTSQNVTTTGNDLNLGSGAQLGLTSNNGALLTLQNNITTSGTDGGIRVEATGGTGMLGAGATIVSGTASYTGPTVMAARSALFVDVGARLPADTAVVFEGGPNVAPNNSSRASIYLVSGSHSIGSVQGAGGGLFVQSQSIYDLLPLPAGTLTIGASGADSNWGGLLFGDAGSRIIKAGTGSFVFSGRGFVSEFDVAAGLFQLDGTSTGTFSVGSGATLAGSGFIGDIDMQGGNGTLRAAAGGTVAPGSLSTVGSLSVQDDAFLAVGSILKINTGSLTAANLSDRLQVGGTVTLQGIHVRVDPLVAPYSTDPGSPNTTVIVGAGNLTGTVADVSAPALFRAAVAPVGNDLVLSLYRLTAQGFAADQNSLQLATSLEAYLGQSSLPTGGPGLSAFLQLDSAGALTRALRQISGGLHAQFLSVLAREQPGVLQLANYLRDGARPPPPAGADARTAGAVLQAAPAVPCWTDRKPGEWCARTQGFNTWGRIDADALASEARYDLGGGNLLFDCLGVDARSLTGFYVGFTGGSLDEPSLAARSTLDGFRLGAYTYHNWDSVYAMAIGQYASNDFSTARALQIGAFSSVAQARYSGDGLALYGEAGLHHQLGRFELDPYLAVQANHQRQDGFTESGASDLNLAVGRATANAVLGGAGLRVRRPWRTDAGRLWSPELRVRYFHDFDDPQATVSAALLQLPATAFSVSSPDPGRDFAFVGAGLVGQISSSSNIIVRYDTQFAGRQTAQSADVSVSWKF